MLPDEEELEKKAAPATAGDRLFLVLFCVVLFGLFIGDVVDDFMPRKLSILFFIVSWIILTPLHEAAHAVMARAVGWQVHQVELGFGPVLSTLKIGTTQVIIKAFPLVGLVSLTPQAIKRPRLENALIYAAGPGIELLSVLMVIQLFGYETLTTSTDSIGIVAAQSWCVAAIFGAGLNLLPFSPAPGMVTDGMGILLSPFLPRAHFEGLLVRPIVEQGNALIEQDRFAEALAVFETAIETYPRIILLQMGIAIALVGLQRSEEALLRMQAFVRSCEGKEREEAAKGMEELRTYIRKAR